MLFLQIEAQFLLTRRHIFQQIKVFFLFCEIVNVPSPHYGQKSNTIQLLHDLTKHLNAQRTGLPFMMPHLFTFIVDHRFINHIS